MSLGGAFLHATFSGTAHGFDSGAINGGWRARSNCRGLEDKDVMWPLNKAGDTVERARRICDGCPVDVRLKCLQDGVDADDWESVRGGLTGAERKRHHRDGLKPEDYPPHSEPIRPVKNCARCDGGFLYDPQHPFARICPACMAKAMQRTARKRVKV